MDIPHALFEEKLEAMKEAKGVKLDNELTASDLKELVEQYKEVYIEAKGEPFPSGIICALRSFTLCIKLKAVLS
jgi:pyruvate,orthophosphate dikinase